MKDKWIERFNEKLGDYSLPVDIPEWRPESVRKRKSIPWYVPLVAGVAAALALLLLLPLGGRYGSSAEDCLIAEAVPVLVQAVPSAGPLPAVHRNPALLSTSAASLTSPSANAAPAASGTSDPIREQPATDDTAGEGTTPLVQSVLPGEPANDTPSTPAAAETSVEDPEDAPGIWDDGRDRAPSRTRSFSFNLRAGNSGIGGLIANFPMVFSNRSDGRIDYADNTIGGLRGDYNHNTGLYTAGISYGMPGSDLYKALNSLASPLADWSYELPVKAGVGFHYDLTPAIGLESGIDYSLHRAGLCHSDGTRKGTDIRYRLHYIGIPLKVSAGFEPVERLRLYGVAGGEAQMLVSGETTITSYSKKQSSKVEGHPFQYSLTAAAGLDFSLTRHLSLFAEPGVAWYFKLPENLPSYYRERPLSFDLQLGLRVSFKKSQP